MSSLQDVRVSIIISIILLFSENRKKSYIVSSQRAKFTLPHSPEHFPPHRRRDLYCPYRQWSSPPGKLSHLKREGERDGFGMKGKTDKSLF